MSRTLGELGAAYDGPIPPAERAAARWGRGAWRRLARGAEAALLEARLGECRAALARIRLCEAEGEAADRLVRAIARYRMAASGLA